MKLYHVYNRGNHKERICFNSNDLHVLKKMFLNTFGSSRKASLVLLCIMPNHFHLLVAVERREYLSVWMRDIGRDYTTYMNRRYGLVGRIFQGPYQKIVVGDFIYFRTLVQYMRDNPKSLLSSKHLSYLVENRILIEYYDFLLSTSTSP